MNIRFHTNLDNVKQAVYHQTDSTTHWSSVPQIGSIIQFTLPIEPKGSLFELEVVSVRYSANGQECTVELHIPSIMRMSINEWDKWMKERLRG